MLEHYNDIITFPYYLARNLIRTRYVMKRLKSDHREKKKNQSLFSFSGTKTSDKQVEHYRTEI